MNIAFDVIDPVANRVFKPVNFCIYCGNDGDIGRYSSEHIFPKGLGGNVILPNASCRYCANKTSLIERRLLRGGLWPFRALLGVHSGRRRGEQPHEFDQVYYDRDGKPFIVSRPISEMCVNLVVPSMPQPGFLDPRSFMFQHNAVNKLSIYQISEGTIAKAMGEDLAKQGAASMEVSGHIQLDVLIPFISKIGHSYAWALYGDGLEYYLRPFIFDNIFPDSLFFVGAMQNCSDELVGGGGSFLGSSELRFGDKIVVVVLVAIFINKIKQVFIAIAGHKKDKI